MLATVVPGWAPAVGWAFGWGARTGDRHDNHWIDDVAVQSGYLLDVGTVSFGVSLNDGPKVDRTDGVPMTLDATLVSPNERRMTSDETLGSPNERRMTLECALMLWQGTTSP